MKASSTARRLRFLMDERNLKQVDILNDVKKAGNYISKSALSQYVNGRTEPDQEKLTILAKALGVSEAWLMGYDVPIDPGHYQPPQREPAQGDKDGFSLISLAGSVSIPVAGHIPAGIPLEAIEDVVDHINIPAEWIKDGQEFIGLMVSGDSMFPTILDGDIVVIRLQPCAETGDICACYVNGYDVTLKRVKITETSITLQPENSNYAPVTYTHPGEVIILGVVVEVRRKL